MPAAASVMGRTLESPAPSERSRSPRGGEEDRERAAILPEGDRKSLIKDAVGQNLPQGVYRRLKTLHAEVW